MSQFTDYDDGTGTATYAAGDFSLIGGSAISRVAKWNGSAWTSLGPGAGVFDGTVAALHAFGGELVAGGAFTHVGATAASHVARWNGSSWSPAGAGLNGGVSTFCVYDDGTGPALYAGGRFGFSGSTIMGNVARWNGASWSPVGTLRFQGIAAPNLGVTSLCVHDDGTGPALFASGVIGPNFLTAVIWKFQANVWSIVTGPTAGTVTSLLSTGATSIGGALYASGNFATIGGVPALSIAVLTPAGWLPVGGGMKSYLGGPGVVECLARYDDGTGAVLVASGQFAFAGKTPVANVAAWDGNAWNAFGDGLNSLVNTVHQAQINGAPALLAGGWFEMSGAETMQCVAYWQGGAWHAMAAGVSSPISVMTVWDDGTGPALYAAGSFMSVGGTPARGIAKWDGTSWSPVGIGLWTRTSNPWTILPPTVTSIVGYDDGTGPALYCAGTFDAAGGVHVNNIAKWDGQAWSTVGTGVAANSVDTMTVWNDGAGDDLFVAGALNTAGGVPVQGIARWDGAGWSQVGSGIATSASNHVKLLFGFDDGFGPKLYAGGAPQSRGTLRAWDGKTWSTSTAGTGGSIRTTVIHDDGSGPALYAAVDGLSTGSMFASRAVARFTGTTWAAVGNIPWTTNIVALASMTDATGPCLYAAWVSGVGVGLGGVLRWNGAAWTSVATFSAGTAPWNTGPRALAAFASPAGNHLYCGGSFMSVNGVLSPGIAQFSGLGPWISAQPSSQTVSYGQPVALTATATVSTFGTSALSWQWRKNGAPITGATTATFQIPSAQFSDSGVYDGVASCGVYSATTAPATITVRACLLSLTQPGGAGSLLIQNLAGPPLSHYFTTISFDQQNAINPGSGAWFGLCTQLSDVATQWLLQAPPFVGTLDQNGGSSFSLDAGYLPATLAGLTFAGVTAIYSPPSTNVEATSPVASVIVH